MRSRCQCSMCPAIHINSRSWLRSSSTHEPSDPPLRVVFSYNVVACDREFGRYSFSARLSERKNKRLDPGDNDRGSLNLTSMLSPLVRAQRRPTTDPGTRSEAACCDHAGAHGRPAPLVPTTKPFRVFVNDPSAGSPTETLLRLLLPLDDQVRSSSRPLARRLPTTPGPIRGSH